MKKDTKNFIYAKTGVVYSKNDIDDWLPLYEEYKSGTSLWDLGIIFKLNRGTIKKYFITFDFKLRSMIEIGSSRSTLDKRESTNTQRYQNKFPSKLTKMKEKSQKTNLSKYGSKNASQSSEVKKRIKDTRFSREGVIKESILKKKGYSLLEEYKGIRLKEVEGKFQGWIKYLFKHDLCGTSFTTDFQGIPKCPVCFPKRFGRSQKVISDYIESTNLEIKINDRKMIAPKEIDILIPELGMGFEYNGTYHHSSKFQKDKNYHKMKSDLCFLKDIKLYHIWEHDDKEIIKSMIESTLLKSNDRYYARKLKIKEVPIKERREFFNSNHLHGDVNSNFALGLYEDTKLVSCISFRKHKEGIEIARFATLLNSSCVGGFSRLLKSSIVKCKELSYSKIITYCDRDWTPNHEDSVYFKNGFSFVGDTGVQLKYWDNNILEVKSRETFQKHKLKDMFPETYSDDKTADQILEENDIHAIYNSGNWKFEMELK